MSAARRLLALILAVSFAGRLTFGAQTPAPPTAAVSGAAPSAPKKLTLDLPPGDGREVVVRLCSDCHSLLNVLTHRYSPQGWEDEVSDMVSRGLAITDDEFEKSVDYLRVQFGRVNVNKASAEDLQIVLELAPAAASAVVAARQRAPLATLDDLKRVLGVEADAIETRKERVMFSEDR